MIAMKENMTSNRKKNEAPGNIRLCQSTVLYQILFFKGEGFSQKLHCTCIWECAVVSSVVFTHAVHFLFFWLSTPDKGTWNLVSSLLVNSVPRISCILDSDVFPYYSLAWYRYSGCTNVRGMTFKQFNQGQGTEIKYFVENRMSFAGLEINFFVREPAGD